MSVKNYFSLFALPVSFAVDAKALDAAYFQLQRETHPDQLSGKPEAERILAAQRSMLVNDAYKTLKSPLKRMEHMLALQGIRLAGEGAVKATQGLLLAMMERGEALHELPTPSAVDVFIDEIQQSSEQLLRAFGTATNAGEWQKAAQIAMEIRFLERLAENAEAYRITLGKAQANAV